MKDTPVFKIRNKNQHIEAIVCKSSWSKARGLMFSKKKSLIFLFKKPRKLSLHMFFVSYPIDVILLDQNKKVIEVKKNFKPWTTYTSKVKCSYAIESPSGEFSAKIGDKLTFEKYINP